MLSFEEHVRRIDFHDTALKNMEIQKGQLTQTFQERNNAVFQREKGSNSKEKINVFPYKPKKYSKWRMV